MTVRSLMRERLRIDRQHGYRRRRADSRHFSLEWLKSREGRVFSGGDSVTLEGPKIKYVRGNSPYWPLSPGELARAYLNRLMREQLGWPRITPHFKPTLRDTRLLAIPAALAFLPERGRDGYFVYVDIGACYFDLFAPWPLNASFNETTGAVGRPVPALVIPPEDLGWLRREKPIRHCLFGMMQSLGLSWYQDGRAVNSKPFINTFTAPEIVALVKLSCHSIARTAVEEFGCRMWLTDAGIFPEREALLFQLWLADKWRLDSKPKAQGNGHLYAHGSYRIGRTVTKGQHVDLPGWQNLQAAPGTLAERRRERLVTPFRRPRYSAPLDVL